MPPPIPKPTAGLGHALPGDCYVRLNNRSNLTFLWSFNRLEVTLGMWQRMLGYLSDSFGDAPQTTHQARCPRDSTNTSLGTKYIFGAVKWRAIPVDDHEV